MVGFSVAGAEVALGDVAELVGDGIAAHAIGECVAIGCAVVGECVETLGFGVGGLPQTAGEALAGEAVGGLDEPNLAGGGVDAEGGDLLAVGQGGVGDGAVLLGAGDACLVHASSMAYPGRFAP